MKRARQADIAPTVASSSGPGVLVPGVTDLSDAILARAFASPGKTVKARDDSVAAGFGTNVQLLEQDIALLSFRFPDESRVVLREMLVDAIPPDPDAPSYPNVDEVIQRLDELQRRRDERAARRRKHVTSAADAFRQAAAIVEAAENGSGSGGSSLGSEFDDEEEEQPTGGSSTRSRSSDECGGSGSGSTSCGRSASASPRGNRSSGRARHSTGHHSQGPLDDHEEDDDVPSDIDLDAPIIITGARPSATTAASRKGDRVKKSSAAPAGSGRKQRTLPPFPPRVFQGAPLLPAVSSSAGLPGRASSSSTSLAASPARRKGAATSKAAVKPKTPRPARSTAGHSHHGGVGAVTAAAAMEDDDDESDDDDWHPVAEESCEEEEDEEEEDDASSTSASSEEEEEEEEDTAKVVRSQPAKVRPPHHKAALKTGAGAAHVAAGKTSLVGHTAGGVPAVSSGRGRGGAGSKADQLRAGALQLERDGCSPASVTSVGQRSAGGVATTRAAAHAEPALPVRKALRSIGVNSGGGGAAAVPTRSGKPALSLKSSHTPPQPRSQPPPELLLGGTRSWTIAAATAAAAAAAARGGLRGY